MEWLSGWSYRKEITVTNTNADYQTKILIGKTSDAVGEDVDCGGHIADDFDDLRFTAADGTTLLDYWIESIVDSGGTKLATVWVQNNATPDTTLYMYYGGTEVAVSSGADTFIAFDDFERGNDGDEVGGGWTIVQGDIDISTEQARGGTRSMKLIGGATRPIVTIPVTHGDIAIRMRVYKEDTSVFTFGHASADREMYVQAQADEDIVYYDGAWKDTGSNITPDIWQLFEFRDFDWTNNTFDIILDAANIGDDLTTRTDITYTDKVMVSGQKSAADTWIDNFLVRKWAAVEPSFAWGSEETPPAAGRSYGFIINPYGLNIIRAGGR